ncbi:MAG: ThuA domain-containing protein [Rhodospirillaceae bacterium]|nr:MAG: ThuA domain-containing protein [Rhodospirillaceae bacterium]
MIDVTPKKILVVTKGHHFDRGAFFEMLEQLQGPGGEFVWTHVEHPAAAALFKPEAAAAFDAFLMYDMPGITFQPLSPPTLTPPPPGFMNDFEALLERGMPFVFLHHAIAGWPTSERYAEIMGGRFLYQPAVLRGSALPDSGYRHFVTHHIESVARHAVTAGLEDGFDICDEVYLFEVFESDVVPLMRSQHPFTADGFYSAHRAVTGQMYSRAGWNHKPGSNLIAWTRREKSSPIVYIQCGDGPTAYGNAGFRRLLANALTWVVSPEAKDISPHLSAGTLDAR